MESRQPQAESAAATSTQPTLLRIHSVIQLTGLAKSTIYKLMAAHEFPTPVQLTSRAVAWRTSDLQKWTDERQKQSH